MGFSSWAIFCLKSLSWIPWNLSICYISFHEKKIPNDAVTLQCQSQFTQKMWIDLYNECYGMTSFMDFMWCIKAWNGSGVVTSKAIACTRDGLLLPRTKSPVICLRPGRPIMATGRQPVCQVLHSFPLVHPSRLLIIANVLSSGWAADLAVPILHKIPKQCSSEALFVQYVVGATK